MRTDVTPISFDSTSPRMQAAARYVWLLAALFPDEDLITVEEEDIPDLPPRTPGER
jgi:hypothetical protein